MYHIIVNPAAGRGRSLTWLPELTKKLDQYKLPYEIRRTAAPQDARSMARAVCASGSDGVIGVGGDGTLQEITAGMRDAYPGGQKIAVPLGILPCGSGNDFALTFYGKKKNIFPDKIASLAENIREKRTRWTDLIDINQGGQTLLNIANMGLDARIVQNAAALKQRLGSQAYLAASYKSITHHKNIAMEIEADGVNLSGAYTLAAVCNGQYYGGGLRIAPAAAPDDGYITLCLVNGMKRAKLMVLFPSILLGRHIRLKDVHFRLCRKLTIKLPESEMFCADGNLYAPSGMLSFEIRPAALRIYSAPV